MSDTKTILLHVCCAPCAGGCVKTLLERQYRVILFFANSNLDTQEEFQRRLEAVRTLAQACQLELHVAPYQHQDWLCHVAGLEQEPERGARCPRCFSFSLTLAAQKCRELSCDAFTTSLTVSPHKDSRLLLQLGAEFENFAPFDFKKQDGFLRSRNLARKYNFYLQNYCGCEFSRKAVSVPT